jgi:hypothetical protein
MMRSFALSFLFACAALIAGARAQSVQFADGRLLVCEVDAGSVTAEGMRVKRVDNGGVLDLKWENLSAASALAWKKKFDLVGENQDEILVRVDEIDYSVGDGGKQTVIGRIDSQTADAIVVMSKGVPITIKRTDLRGAPRKVDVPVTQAYTRDEYYTEQLQQAQPGNDADKNLLFAEMLMRAHDYEHARDHATKAKQLGTSKNPQQVDATLAKVQRYLDAAKEIKQLEAIAAARSRGGLSDFENGVKLIAQFEKDFPPAQSKLQTEFKAEKTRFAAARTRFLTGQVADKWRDAIRVIAEKAVADGTLGLQQARDYATNKMTDDIVARLATQLRLDANEIKQLWAGRKDTPIGKRTEHFSYSVGSWVLKQDGILKDTEQGKVGDKSKSKDAQPANGNPGLDRFVKLVKEAMDRRRQAVQGQGASKEQTDEDWWHQADKGERVSWLRAYYAEYSGQLVVTFAWVTPCLNCQGEGTLPEMDPTTSKMVRNKCFLCQGTKWLRSFKAY